MKEFRYTAATELRAARIGDEAILEGYASTFNSESHDLGGYTEFVKPGAFKRSLAEGADVRCLMNHNSDAILGRIRSGTLKVKEDSKGLWFRCSLPDTQIARDLHVSISRGDVSQCSFAFSVTKEGQSWAEEKNAAGKWIIKRFLNDVDLADVSAVTYPAYEDTVVEASSSSPSYKTPTRAVEVPIEVRSRIEARKAGLYVPAAPAIHSISDAERFDRLNRTFLEINQ